MRVRPLVFVPLLSALGLGCEKSPQDRLEGTWVGDGVSAVHPSQAGRAGEWAKQTKVEFKGNSVTVSIPAEEPRSGTFKVAKVEGNDMDLVFKRKAGGEDRSRMTFVDDDTLRWSLGGGPELTLKKQ